MRNPGDPAYKDGVLEVSDEIEMLISQIKMMLFTRKGEVLGAPNFGVNLEDELFTFKRNEFQIRTMLMDQTQAFIRLAEKYQVYYDVKFSRGTVRDICVITILIDGTKAFSVLVT